MLARSFSWKLLVGAALVSPALRGEVEGLKQAHAVSRVWPKGGISRPASEAQPQIRRIPAVFSKRDAYLMAAVGRSMFTRWWPVKGSEGSETFLQRQPLMEWPILSSTMVSPRLTADLTRLSPDTAMWLKFFRAFDKDMKNLLEFQHPVRKGVQAAALWWPLRAGPAFLLLQAHEGAAVHTCFFCPRPTPCSEVFT